MFSSRKGARIIEYAWMFPIERESSKSFTVPYAMFVVGAVGEQAIETLRNGFQRYSVRSPSITKAALLTFLYCFWRTVPLSLM